MINYKRLSLYVLLISIAVTATVFAKPRKIASKSKSDGVVENNIPTNLQLPDNISYDCDISFYVQSGKKPSRIEGEFKISKNDFLKSKIKNNFHLELNKKFWSKVSNLSEEGEINKEYLTDHALNIFLGKREDSTVVMIGTLILGIKNKDSISYTKGSTYREGKDISDISIETNSTVIPYENGTLLYEKSRDFGLTLNCKN